MGTNISLIILLGSVVVGAIVGIVVSRSKALSLVKKMEDEAEEIIEEARKKAKNIEDEAHLESKEIVIQARAECEEEIKEKRKEAQELERKFLQKESNLDKKVNIIDSKEAEISRKEKYLLTQAEQCELQKQKYEKLTQSISTQLEKIAGMTAEEAKRKLREQIEDMAKKEAAIQVKKIQEEAREESEKEAKHIISFAIQRYAGEFVTAHTVSTVGLPSDEMKGRIIGREGRNIRTFEQVTGVDVIIDDTPETVILSSFDPIRREVAKISLERLIEDGRIHPSRIEEVVVKVEEEVKSSIRDAGEQATFEVGVHGIHQDILDVLGSLKYRTNNGQNILHHSIEVAFLCGMMAGELGLDTQIAKRAGLLHDIGHALDHTQEGSSAEIGAQFVKKYGEPEEVVHAIRSHEGAVKPQTVLAHVLAAANQLSTSRPGAKRENLQAYVKRLEDLEAIARTFEGVTRAFAIQAGREIKVLVNHQRISDEDAVMLARDISKKIESDLTYPGQIRVNVLRETRVVEIAR
ncbi:MAG: ribonuclease Y [Deltaproteobacteria bacterium]|nr:ribonuclease Y [Deltaproteobacteria bacterium]